MIDENEDPTEELIEVIPEPEHSENEESKKPVVLKTSSVIDQAKYECSINKVEFKPTLMYAQRTFKFTIKNTSLIALNYNFKIANSMTGILDAGPYSIMPKKGSIAPQCDDNFIIKFNINIIYRSRTESCWYIFSGIITTIYILFIFFII